MNPANLLTSLRIALIPVFVPLFFWETSAGVWLSLAVACLMELSDALDGWAARRWNGISDLGKVFDPFADSFGRLSIFICFAVAGWTPVGLVLTLLFRDGLVSMVRTLAAHRGVLVASRLSGKIKAVAQATAILGSLGMRAAVEAGWAERVQPTAWLLTAGATAVTAWSAFDYVWGNRKALRPS